MEALAAAARMRAGAAGGAQAADTLAGLDSASLEKVSALCSMRGSDAVKFHRLTLVMRDVCHDSEHAEACFNTPRVAAQVEKQQLLCVIARAGLLEGDKAGCALLCRCLPC